MGDWNYIMTTPTPNQIRQQILKEKGITSFKPTHGKHAKLKHTPIPTINRKSKTPLMRYFELVHGEPIERILLSGSLSVVAGKLDNEVDVSTISKWIKKLKLRYTEDNLPNCDGCPRRASACDSGICYILIDLELYDLLQVKRKEMMV